MSIELFAKLFDTPSGQLLAFLDETEDGDPCLHVIGAYVNGVRPSAKASWPSGNDGEAKAEAALAKLDQPMAEAQAASLRAVVARLGTGVAG